MRRKCSRCDGGGQLYPSGKPPATRCERCGGTGWDPLVPQPPPEANDSPPIWDLVIEDMKRRDKEGRRKYGTPLQADNGRDALADAYQEALDLCVYLRQAIYERDR